MTEPIKLPPIPPEWQRGLGDDVKKTDYGCCGGCVGCVGELRRLHAEVERLRAALQGAAHVFEGIGFHSHVSAIRAALTKEKA